MLERKGEALDAQEVDVTQETVEPETKGVRREFGEEPCRQAPEGMGMVGLDGEWLVELTVHGFNQLAEVIVAVPHLGGRLYRLVGTWQREQADISLDPQGRRQGGTDIPLVP